MNSYRSIPALLALILCICHAGYAGEEDVVNTEVGRGGTAVATFAGGCFWCTEADFERIDGVEKVISGYTGGSKRNPSYEEVCSGNTGHFEAVQVYFDPDVVSYEKLLDVFWRIVDPTDPGGQFVDRGSQYRTAIFYHNDDQKAAAEASKRALASSGVFEGEIVTPVIEFDAFYEAEGYHQGYYRACPARYKRYRSGSGRDRFLDRVWGGGGVPAGIGGADSMKNDDAAGEKNRGSRDRVDGELPGEKGAGSIGDAGMSERGYRKPDISVLKEKLTPMQFKVTQNCGTEPPFRNEYWDNKREGIYVDVVTGEPLFCSLDKYDSGSGWPSFTRPLEEDNITEHEDLSHSMVRIEVRSRGGGSHLGHLFSDGPGPAGMRYCINSASLRFIPKEDLEKEGYGEYLELFE